MRRYHRPVTALPVTALLVGAAIAFEGGLVHAPQPGAAAQGRPAPAALVSGSVAPLNPARRARAATGPRRLAPPARPVTPRRPLPPARPAPPTRPVAARPAPAVRVAVVRRPAPPAPAGPTSWAALNRAIARIPTYHGTGARWVVYSDDGYWGTADWQRRAIYIGPQVPEKRLYDVAVHEWSHLLSAAAYGGDTNALVAATAKWFGGSGLTGAERAADCMALLQGATWTHYTRCADARWRAGADRLLHLRRL
jgi:hypothetical protein